MQKIDGKPDRSWIEKISPSLAARWGVIPFYRRDDGAVAVLTKEIHNLETFENLKVLLNAPVAPIELSEIDFNKALHDHYGVGADAIDELGPASVELPSSLNVEENSDAAMVRFVNGLIIKAMHERATDIHIEPFDDELLIRFRIDGILHPVPVPPQLTKFRALLASRIKLMAQMNIAEKRVPQDGRIRFRSGADDIDIRVSTLPTMDGESIDLRLLPRKRLLLGLEDLGMQSENLAIISKLIRRPNGILLVTGPTGHGKTTTLYAFLSQINTPDKKIITIEDPVEYRLRGVNQVQTHSKIGLTFANGLRSVLRQDPDIILVGEIRDKETAEIAIRASLTGHLVFSTLHTNDAIGAVTRLVDMGIEPYLVASSLNAVLAQRLVRVVCSACKGDKIGCETCRGTGYFGRTALFEFFVINEELRALILNRAPEAVLREKALANGMRTLYQDGKVKVDSNITSMEEVRRVTEEI